MQHIQRWANEEEHILERFGDAGQKRRQGNTQKKAGIFLAALLGHTVVHGQCGGGQTEHHGREAPREKARPLGKQAGMIRVGKLGEEDVLGTHHGVAGNDSGAAQLRVPEHGIDHVVQADGPTQAHEEAIEERTDDTGSRDDLSRMNEQLLKRRPDDIEQGSDKDRCQARDDRHETRAAKEAQDLRKLDVLVAVVQGDGHEANDEGADDAGIDRRTVRVKNREQRGRGRRHDQVSHNARERRHTLVAAGKTNAKSDAQQHGKVGEHHVSRRAHDLEGRL